MREKLVFYVNRHRQEISGEDVYLPLTAYLRERLGLCGTKVVCAEGDCGSCTLFIGRPTSDGIRYRTVCGCIQYLFQLDATHIVTIEGLNDPERLNPIQSAMVDCHGAQCGFCTPGFIVALQQHFELGNASDPESVRRSLVGNLCRCTGYVPILQAAAQIDPSAIRPVASIFSTEPIEAELLRLSKDEVRLQTSKGVILKPTSMERAVRFRAEYPLAVPVAGCTDLGVVANKGKRDFSSVLFLGGINDFDRIHRQEKGIVVGGGVPLQDFEDFCKTDNPEYARFLAWFGSPPIKHAGTLGGNIANGSPIGDTLPALMVLDAEVELVGSQGARRVNMNAFYTGYRKSVMSNHELISCVFIPRLAPSVLFRLHKVSQRKDLDISTVSAAYWVRVEQQVIVEARIALGGVGATILRLPRTEAFLRGKSHSQEIWKEAGEEALGEIAPISDVRGSDLYRRQLVRLGMIRFWHQTAEAVA